MLPYIRVFPSAFSYVFGLPSLRVISRAHFPAPWAPHFPPWPYPQTHPKLPFCLGRQSCVANMIYFVNLCQKCKTIFYRVSNEILWRALSFTCVLQPPVGVCVCGSGRGSALGMRQLTEAVSLSHSPPVSFAPLACVGICNLAKREITFKLNCKPNKLRGFGAGMGGVAAQLNLPEIYDYDWTQMEFLSFCGLLSV